MFRASKQKCPVCGGEMSQVAKTCWNCRKHRLKRKCAVCGKEFEYKASTNRQTCSKECCYKLRGVKSGQTQSKKILKLCKQCGAEFSVSPSKLDHEFCSSDCWYKWNSGENNARWQGGITSERAKFDTSPEWGKIRKQVWVRDKATCQVCGKIYSHDQQTYECHHIIPFANEETRFDLNNIILVCRECHLWIHSPRNANKEYIMPLDTDCLR